jgi:hypothetical protein
MSGNDLATVATGGARFVKCTIDAAEGKAADQFRVAILK